MVFLDYRNQVRVDQVRPQRCAERHTDRIAHREPQSRLVRVVVLLSCWLRSWWFTSQMYLSEKLERKHHYGSQAKNVIPIFFDARICGTCKVAWVFCLHTIEEGFRVRETLLIFENGSKCSTVRMVILHHFQRLHAPCYMGTASSP